jgi:esterase
MKLLFQEYGAGHPLLILHGFLGSLDNWHTLSKRFGQSWRVLAVDQRNHGRSPHSNVFTIDAMAGDLAELLDLRAIPSAFVLGHSMGGKTAMQFALTFPERVDKLIVVDIAPRSYPRLHDEILDAMRSVKLTGIRSRQQVDDELSKKIREFALRQFLMKNLGRTERGTFFWRANLDVLNEHYDEIAQEIRADKPFLRPTLFLKSNRSSYIFESDTPAMAHLFPNMQIVGFDTGHWIHAEAPDRFFEVVRSFLLDNRG